ncbi:Class I peptide chain release factor, partial [Zea mays]
MQALLDLLFAVEGSVSDATKILGLSTGALSRLILSDDSLRTAANELRASKCFFDCRAPMLYYVLLTLQDSVHKVFYAVVEAAAVRADNNHLGGLVRYPVSTTLPQIGSRLFLTWGVFWSFP